MQSNDQWLAGREFQPDGKPVLTEAEFRRIIFPVEEALAILPKHMRASVARLRPDLVQSIREIELLGA